MDLHFLREKREKEIQKGGSKETLHQEGVTESYEISLMKMADRTILVSEYEKKLIEELDFDVKTSVIPIPREIPGIQQGFEKRKDIVFIGGFLHKPNIDAVHFFINDIWPLIHKEIPDCKFLIVGSNIPDEIKLNAGSNISVVGFVPELKPIFTNCRITIAPLRYGAGIKGKVITSLSYGVPCVATSIAAEGMGCINGKEILISDDPKEFAKLIVEVYKDKDKWEYISQNGLEFVKKKFSLEVFEENLKNLINDSTAITVL